MGIFSASIGSPPRRGTRAASPTDSESKSFSELPKYTSPPVTKSASPTAAPTGPVDFQPRAPARLQAHAAMSKRSTVAVFFSSPVIPPATRISPWTSPAAAFMRGVPELGSRSHRFALVSKRRASVVGMPLVPPSQ